MFRNSMKTAGVRVSVLVTLMILLFLSSIKTSYGMCPLCTAGAAIGLSLARYYGLSDLIVGLWLGALAVSTGLWIAKITKKRLGRKMPLQTPIIFSLAVAATVIPFYYAGFFNGMPGMSDTLFGINKLFLGIIVGGIITYAGAPMSNLVKKIRGAAFPFQGIFITLGLMMLASILIWYAGI